MLFVCIQQEWGAACPHEFLGAYRLEYDQSWTEIKDIVKKDAENAVIDKIFNSQLAIASGSSTAEVLGFKKDENSSQISEIADS